ncbi:hypothetical protein GobsT_02030 [Gemmata obscuriglobus]|uniref:Uncharacterized protein n=1 Tax=Gemmata obscuriglobus TaxID=114 RepID=A0A2Z3HDZ7_9BACT|nr:hypothetical protein [Gemmata obscuriglobus]AWM41185.1 hypothetical protein C1280_32140 [Gemmata obscuriglobus]QEG25477.1 hypothetical protein GobsT_02030 [Gemmata obscuriglobus]VTR98696.1 unnamed protein product [Gemmata obscuriglobus UQM 2246]
MRDRSDDATDLSTNLFGGAATQPQSVDPAALRRAMRYGERAREQFWGMSFRAVEAELSSGWYQRGETTEWDWVRAAVRVGFEQGEDV